jgi:hypothetical protein
MDDLFGGLMAPWKNAQQPMMKVVRWGNFTDYGQTLVEHSNSVQFVLLWVQSRLASRSDVDWALLQRAFLVHDHGEPLSGGYEHAGNKTPDKEVEEYRGFHYLLSRTETDYRNFLMQAFLLQYVRKKQWWNEFSAVDRAMVVFLREKYQVEALLFEAVERLDYLASALEGHHRTPPIGNEEEMMMDHVLGNQIPKLDALALEWSPFAKRVWTLKLRESFLALGSR